MSFEIAAMGFLTLRETSLRDGVGLAGGSQALDGQTSSGSGRSCPSATMAAYFARDSSGTGGDAQC